MPSDVTRDSCRQLHMEATLKDAMEDTPVVCILGPRRCGKSALAMHVAPHRKIHIQASRMESPPRLWHYRDQDQIEVDCVMTHDRQTWGIEIKAASTVSPSDARGLRSHAQQTGKDFRGGLVLYDGESVLPLDKNLHLYAAPISKLWQPSTKNRGRMPEDGLVSRLVRRLVSRSFSEGSSLWRRRKL